MLVSPPTALEHLRNRRTAPLLRPGSRPCPHRRTGSRSSSGRQRPREGALSRSVPSRSLHECLHGPAAARWGCRAARPSSPPTRLGPSSSHRLDLAPACRAHAQLVALVSWISWNAGPARFAPSLSAHPHAEPQRELVLAARSCFILDWPCLHFCSSAQCLSSTSTLLSPSRAPSVERGSERARELLLALLRLLRLRSRAPFQLKKVA